MIKWVLVLYLVNPTSNVETTRFVIVDTEQQCQAMKQYVDSPAYKEKSKRHAPHHRYMIEQALCDTIDLSKYKRK